MDELIREVERNIRNSKELLKVVENRVAYQKNDLATKREAKAQLEFYEGVYRELEYAKSCHEFESKYGCSIDVVVKAILNGVWVEVEPIDIDIENPQYMYLEEYVKLEMNLDGILCLNCHDYVDELKLSDYKKTWWLKEDKSN